MENTNEELEIEKLNVNKINASDILKEIWDLKLGQNMYDNYQMTGRSAVVQEGIINILNDMVVYETSDFLDYSFPSSKLQIEDKDAIQKLKQLLKKYDPKNIVMDFDNIDVDGIDYDNWYRHFGDMADKEMMKIVIAGVERSYNDVVNYESVSEQEQNNVGKNEAVMESDVASQDENPIENHQFEKRILKDSFNVDFTAPNYWSNDDISKWNEMTGSEVSDAEIISTLGFVVEATKVINGQEPLEYINNIDYLILPEKIESIEELVNKEKEHRNSAYELFQREYKTQQNVQETEDKMIEQEQTNDNISSSISEEIEETIDNGIEQVQSNGGMSEASMEADIAAIDAEEQFVNESEVQEEPEVMFYDSNNNPHYPQTVLSVLENFSNVDIAKWNLPQEDKTDVYHLIDIAELKKNDYENSVAKLREYLQSEEFKKEEENYARIFTPILMTNQGQDFDSVTHTFSSEKFSFPFSTDDIKQEVEEQTVESPEPVQKEKTEISMMKGENDKIVYGKTVLPSFVVGIENNPQTVENSVVMSFNRDTQSYLVDNGTEKIELPKKTFDTLFNKNIEHEEKIKRAEGRTIVFQNKEQGIEGTVIPEFSMYTNRGLETFKNFVPIKHNPADDSYVISNGDSTITVTAERFKDITAPERFENKFDENSPAWKKLCETQYNDYFKVRDNCAYNFRHNLSVLCRKEANSPCDAFHLAKNIISLMNKDERKKTEKLLKTLAHKGESMNEVIASIYHEATKEIPINEEYIKKYAPQNLIARPMYDVISSEGQKIENDSSLVRNGWDNNLAVGMTLKNVDIKTDGLFGKGKDKIHFDELKVISASKENNSITLMDSNKSFINLPRDSVLDFYKSQQIKEIKHERRQNRNNSMTISYVG